MLLVPAGLQAPHARNARGWRRRSIIQIGQGGLGQLVSLHKTRTKGKMHRFGAFRRCATTCNCAVLREVPVQPNMTASLLAARRATKSSHIGGNCSVTGCSSTSAPWMVLVYLVVRMLCSTPAIRDVPYCDGIVIETTLDGDTSAWPHSVSVSCWANKAPSCSAKSLGVSVLVLRVQELLSCSGEQCNNLFSPGVYANASGGYMLGSCVTG